MKFDWKKFLAYPAIVYAAVFLVVSAMLALKVETTGTLAYVVTTLVSLGLLYYFALKLESANLKEALIYGVVWVVVLAALDYFFTKPFVSGYFESWKTWVVYGYTFLMPTVVMYLKKK